MKVPAKTTTGGPSARTALEEFFTFLESRTSNAIHLRLLKAARKPDPAGALEKELAKIMEELLREN